MVTSPCQQESSLSTAVKALASLTLQRGKTVPGSFERKTQPRVISWKKCEKKGKTIRKGKKEGITIY
jgi:hypothetical protein